MAAASTQVVRKIAAGAVCRHALRSCSADRYLTNPRFAVAEALFAVGRYQIEDASFHPYTSKFDYWLEGKCTLHAERTARLHGVQQIRPRQIAAAATSISQAATACPRSLLTINSRHSGRRAMVHSRLTATPGISISAFAVPTAPICGYDTQYCGMFMTPTLRNGQARGCILPQRCVPHAAAGAGFLRFSATPIRTRFTRVKRTAPSKSSMTCRRSITSMST